MRYGMITFTICLYILSSLNVYAEGDIAISLDQVSEDHEIRAMRGGTFNSTVIIDNAQDSAVDMQLFFEDSEGKNGAQGSGSSLVSRTVFYGNDLSEDAQNSLRDNNNDIATFCRRQYDDPQTVTWCAGQKSINISIDAKEKKTIPITMTIDDDEIDHEFFIKAIQKEKGQEIVREKFFYRVPDRNVSQIDLKNFSLEKKQSVSPYYANIFSDSAYVYESFLTGVNSGTERVNAEYYVFVEPLWFGEKERFSDMRISEPGETQDVVMDITTPRLGPVRIVGGIQYATNAGEIKHSESEPVLIIAWPVQWIIGVCAGICFCMIFVLLYKYINKNMFNFRKNKNTNTIYTDKYIVQDADNIISIAQKFNVSWKELAKENKIDAPFILISGESISVPAGQVQKNDTKHDDAISFVSGTTGQGNVPVESKTMSDEGIVKTGGSAAGREHMSSIAPDADYAINRDRYVAQSAQGGVDNGIQKDVAQQPASMPMQKKKNTITFASPQSTLVQSASEPTTRAIDIEWMRDDEEAYMEEMQEQQKKVSMRLVIVGIIGVLVVGMGVWAGMTFVLGSNDKETVPVEALIQETPQDVHATQDKTTGTEDINEIASQTNDVVSNDVSAAGSDNTSTNEQSTGSVQPQDVTIQVLNAGGKTGAAGVVTKTFSDKGYKTLAAQNAKNNHTDVTIYYNDAQKDHVAEIALMIPEEYGVQKQESSEDVTKQYDADIVIVLGE